ncbi:HAD-IA family hydrolase [Solibacillus sp. CAU 1738]|uniref:HAD family hydrolase n=1 Tax=Solibacillus sp. CAU 1738 TaxID=3140363 RepID=UPI00326073F6
MLKAAIFDLDGTLLNRDASVLEFINKQYERLSKHFSHIPKDIYMKRFIELDHHGYVWKDKVYAQLIEELDITSLTAEQLLNDYLLEFRNHCVPFNNLREMLEDLKKQGLSLGIITNGYGHFQLHNIKALGIEHYFDVILISEWEGIKKPNPEIFERSLSKLQVKPEESMFIGDHPVNDVEAAKNIGMVTVWKKDGAWDMPNADFMIDQLMELPSIVRKLV